MEDGYTATKIAEIRRERKLSQEKLAKLMSCTKQTISNYERGIRKPDIETLKRIARVLDVNPSVLLIGEDFRRFMGNPVNRPEQSLEEFNAEIAAEQQWARDAEISEKWHAGMMNLIQIGLTSGEAELMMYYRDLNDCGKQVARGVLESMTMNMEYTEEGGV